MLPADAQPHTAAQSPCRSSFADEYDAAQERGEVRPANSGRSTSALEAPSVAYIGLTHKDIHEARQIRDAGFVVSLNLKRRHLTESQRGMVASRLAKMPVGANQHSEGLPIGRASNMLNVGKRTVARAKEVTEKGAPELIAAVDAGEASVSAGKLTAFRLAPFVAAETVEAV